MSEQENTQAVRQFFADFGRGDISSALNRFADDVEFHEPGPPDVLPWAGSRRGREQVAQFFATVGETLDIQQFEPREFIAQGDRVVVLGHERSRFKPTGRMFDSPWAMVLTLRGGEITKFDIYHDTAAMVAAARGG